MMITAALASGVLQISAQDTAKVAVRSAPGMLVDFQDADIRTVITALAEAGALNVTYGELPTRRITLRMRQPVARENILPLLRSLARANGLVLTEDGSIIRIDGAGATPAMLTPAVDSAPADVRLFVYRLRHARAARLAGTLQQVFGGAVGGTSASSASSPRTLSDQLRRTQQPDIGPDTSRKVTVEMESVAAAGAHSLPGQLAGAVLIVPEEATNSLLVRAQSRDWPIVQQAIETMDLRPLQVVIEVLIAEVRRTKGLDAGVSATGARVSGSDTSVFGRLAGATSSDFLLRLIRSGRVEADVAISALATRGDVRILSRPVIVAQNGQEAKILVGSERPFVQVSRALPTDAAVRDQVIQYRDVGTSLAILPTINPDGYVNLEVVQEVSNATSETQFGAPIISTRETSTHLFVHDGQTAVLGGLVDRQQDRNRSGIPVLSVLPIVGALFGTTRISTTNSELFLFLTPHIVQSDDDMDRVRGAVEAASPARGDTLHPAEQPLVRIPPRSPAPKGEVPKP